MSTPTGASVSFPAGAVEAGTVVTLSPAAAAPSASGTPASSHAFLLEPAGRQLTTAAAVEMRVSPENANAWLASVVVSGPGGTLEVGESAVDLNAGLLRGDITSLGTVQAVIPEAGAVLRATSLSGRAAVAPAPTAGVVVTPTRTLTGDCGGPGRRCTGLAVEVSPNLLAAVDTLAVVYPRLSGELRISGTRATGTLTLTAPVRVRLGARSVAAVVPSRVTATATAATTVTETPGRITLTHMQVTGRSGSQQAVTDVTLVVEYDGSQAWVRLEHTFNATLSDAGPEPVTFRARVPLLRGL